MTDTEPQHDAATCITPTRRVHELKTDPEVFDRMADGSKTHEIRFNDRGYQVGDVLVLYRTEHTGEVMRTAAAMGGSLLEYSNVPPLRRVVTHILEGYGLLPGWVILSVRPE